MIMGRPSSVHLALLALVCCAGGAYADVEMKLVSPPPGPSLGLYYTSPYVVKIDGVDTWAICDDFTTDITQGWTWTAVGTSISALPSGTVKFTTDSTNTLTQVQAYSAAAYLAGELLALPSDSQKAKDLSYSIWGLFYDGAFDALNGLPTDKANAQAYLADAIGMVTDTDHPLTPENFADLMIYTPTGAKASQEFLVVKTPEAPAVLLLALNVLGGIGFFLFIRRRKARAAV